MTSNVASNVVMEIVGVGIDQHGKCHPGIGAHALRIVVIFVPLSWVRPNSCPQIRRMCVFETVQNMKRSCGRLGGICGDFGGFAYLCVAVLDSILASRRARQCGRLAGAISVAGSVALQREGKMRSTTDGPRGLFLLCQR